MASSTNPQHHQQQQLEQQASQTTSGPGKSTTADPLRRNDNSAAISPGVELDNLRPARNPNDSGTPTATPNMSPTTSPSGQSSAPAQGGGQTAPVEPSSPRPSNTPIVAEPVPPQTAPSTATTTDAAPSQPPVKEPKPAPPSVQITLLLITGARHPYRIDEKYLRKRDVDFADNDPFTISVYTLKELIWRDWREEWEPRPTSPSSIRLIQFGRLLEDKAPLKDCRFNMDAPNVLHMSIKPQEVVDDEDAAKAKHGLGGDREGSSRSTGCRCVIL